MGGKALPTEAEWEFAARGGVDREESDRSSELTLGGRHVADPWQGSLPTANQESDDYFRTSAIGAFSANGYGLLDMVGKVWEWTADWDQNHARSSKPCRNSTAPRVASSRDGSGAERSMARRVPKGGPFLGTPNVSQGCRPAARLAQTIDTTTCHIGFRRVVRKILTDASSECRDGDPGNGSLGPEAKQTREWTLP